MDNIFPHHENERTQSESATGKQFAKYWMHCEHLRVNGKKMSKSLGNFFTLRDLTAKGYSGRQIRYVLLSGHYRQALNFTFAALAAAKVALARLDEFAGRIAELSAGAVGGTETPEWAGKALASFREKLEDDLNMPEALGVVFDMVHAGNRAMDEKKITADEAMGAADVLSKMDIVLGFIGKRDDSADEEVKKLAEQRQAARKNKDWKESDRIRDELKKRGWEARDTPEGPRLKRLTR